MLYKYDTSKRDNKAVKTLQLDDVYFDTEIDTTGIPELYKAVPLLYRCIDIRAKSIQSMPYVYVWRGQEYEVAEEIPQPIKLLHKNISEYLYFIEASLCLTGSAYLLRKTNEYGFNPLPICLPSNKIQPFYLGTSDEPDYYQFYDYARTLRFQPDELIVVWYPNFVDTRYAGISPSQVALQSISASYNLDQFTDNFFRRGAIKSVLLQVGSDNPLFQPSQEQINQISNFWRRLVSGVKNAFASNVVTTNVTPIVIGDGLRDIEYAAISNQKREEIAIAFGVPLTLVVPASANYATANQEYLSYYTTTIIPEANFIAKCLTNELLSQYDIELVFKPERLEVMQENETNKAMNISKLVYSGIMSINEARVMLGMCPVEEEQAVSEMDSKYDDLISVDRGEKIPASYQEDVGRDTENTDTEQQFTQDTPLNPLLEEKMKSLRSM